MAPQFVKWCKTKLVGGCSYKTMTVLGSNLADGQRSDTEDLMKDDASTSSYNHHGAHINPCLLISPSCSENEEIEENHLGCDDHHTHDDLEHVVKFQDFECDLQVERSSESGEEKKEFSFTFYDLDGYGKITKDDVAGLVRSIYGAVNESIKVPQGGKKTIKVKLTVTPEEKSTEDQEEVDQVNNNNNNNNNNQVPSMGNGISVNTDDHHQPGHHPRVPAVHVHKLRNNVNVTIKENLHRERSVRKDKDFLSKDRFCHFSERPKFSSVRLPNKSSAAVAGCKGCRNFSPEVFRDCSASPLRNRKKWRERSCSFHRPELIDIIQANMEKNNVSPCCRHEHTHHQHSLLLNSHHPSCTTTTHQSHHNNQINDPSSLFRNESFWKQKLTEITQQQQNNGGCNNRHPFGGGGVKVHHDCHNHKIQTTAVAAGHGNHWCKKQHGGGGCGYHHQRSRSHDLSQNIFRYQYHADQIISQPLNSAPVITTSTPPCCNNNHNNSAQLNNNNQHQEEECETTQQQLGCNHHLSPRTNNNKNTNVTNASPHQLKHRNREEEHNRAMAQVISWLERENIGGDVMKKCFSPKKKIHNPCFLDDSPPVVKKHEHHHVHEHIHHHYHHYNAKETPIIV